MAVWLVRAGKQGEDEAYAVDNDVVIVGWLGVPDLSGVKSYEEMKEMLRGINPELKPQGVANQAGQLWAFRTRIEKGDLAVLPLKTRSTIAIAKVTGDYEYRDGRHVRTVEWLQKDIPRSNLGQDLLYSLGAFMTVCQIRRNHAEQRVLALLESGKDPNLTSQPVVPVDDETDESAAPLDLEQYAEDQIRAAVEANFRGHEFTRLIAAILRTEGYFCYVAPKGADGGADILAGKGGMGFDHPRLCVQVKSGGVIGDATVRELEGVMGRVNAEQGLFVSWGGFKDSVHKKTSSMFFKVRLWDAQKVIAALLEHYEELPDAIQAELPLKRIWTLVQEGDG